MLSVNHFQLQEVLHASKRFLSPCPHLLKPLPLFPLSILPYHCGMLSDKTELTPWLQNWAPHAGAVSQWLTSKLILIRNSDPYNPRDQAVETRIGSRCRGVRPVALAICANIYYFICSPRLDRNVLPASAITVDLLSRSRLCFFLAALLAFA